MADDPPRAAAVGIFALIGNRSFRVTGTTTYLANDGALGHSLEMVAYESPRGMKWSESDCDAVANGLER